MVRLSPRNIIIVFFYIKKIRIHENGPFVSNQYVESQLVNDLIKLELQYLDQLLGKTQTILF